MRRLLLIIFFAVGISYAASAQHYKGDISISYGVGVGQFGTDNYGFQTTHGYLFNKNLFVGAGIGFLKFKDIDSGVIPIYVNVKGLLNADAGISPYLSMDLGYGAREGGGIYYAPGIGVNFRIIRNMGISVSIHYQSTKIYNENIGSIALKIGFNF